MPAYEEAAEDQFDILDAADWKEIIDSTAYPSSVHVSQDAQEAVVVGRVPWNKRRSAMRYFLGFAYCDEVAPFRLHRETPMPHPSVPWLFAYDCSFTPFGLPQDLAEGDKPKQESLFYPEVYEAYSDHLICTVRYRSFRCEFLEDAAIATNQDEWKRYAYFDPEPKIEALSADGIAQMTFVETSATGPSLAGLGTKFPAPIAVLQAKTGYVLRWLGVPWEYLSEDDDVFFPAKILRCVGRVNSDTFLQKFSPSTVLLNPPRFSFKPFPVANADDPRKPLWAVDIDLPFEYFEPEKHADVLNTNYQGHQILPWRADRKYYGAVREDGVSELLQSAAFNEMFEHVSE